MKILVIGDSCIDEFVYGSTRMNPEAPTAVLKPTRSTNNPGMAANVYENLMAIKGSNDTVELLTHSERIIKRRFVDENSNYILLRVDEEDPTIKPLGNPNNELKPEHNLKDYDMVVISDYNKGFLTEDNIRHIAMNSKLTFLDTKKTLGDWCADIDFIKINEKEFNNPGHQKDGLLISLQEKLIVTLGGKGARYNGKVYPGKTVEVRDVAGAGDTFLAAFAMGYWQHRFGCIMDLPHEHAIDKGIKFANTCSANVVTHPGVVTPRMNEIDWTNE